MPQGSLCPVWIGHLLLSPLRRRFQDPDRIIRPYIKPGMTVLDIGCGMGFLSLPIARIVGPTGWVVCVDLQAGMLRALERRAASQGLLDQIVPRPCAPDSLDLDRFAGSFDFALAFAVVHEVPDASALFRHISAALKPGGRCLMAEPKGHVSEAAFVKTVGIAMENGLGLTDCPTVALSRAALFKKAMPPASGGPAAETNGPDRLVSTGHDGTQACASRSISFQPGQEAPGN